MSSNNELFEKIHKVLEKAPENRNSYYQLKYFILGKQPTTQSQLWQCLTELRSRKDTIETLQLQIEDTKDDLELTNIEIERLQNDEENLTYLNNKLNEFSKKERMVKTRKLKRKQESLMRNINKMESTLQFVVQEARFFLQAFESLQEVEPLKDFDDFEAQKEFWEAKITEEINLKILTRQPLGVDLIQTALSLHNDSEVKDQVINMLENSKNKMQLMQEKDDNVRKQITSNQ